MKRLFFTYIVLCFALMGMAQGTAKGPVRTPAEVARKQTMMLQRIFAEQMADTLTPLQFDTINRINLKYARMRQMAPLSNPDAAKAQQQQKYEEISNVLTTSQQRIFKRWQTEGDGTRRQRPCFIPCDTSAVAQKDN